MRLHGVAAFDPETAFCDGHVVVASRVEQHAEHAEKTASIEEGVQRGACHDGAKRDAVFGERSCDVAENERRRAEGE